MKKNNGFTLIELLATIIILAAIALVAFPILLNTIKNSEGTIDETTSKLIISATKLYIDDNANNYPQRKGNTYCINFDNLIKEKHLEKGILESSDVDTSSKVVKVSVTDNYNYEIVNNSDCTQNILPTCQLISGVAMQVGTEYSCDPGNGEYRTFYVLENKASSDNISLIMDRNIGNSRWCNESDTSCEGSIALEFLNSKTADWTAKPTLPTVEQILAVDGYSIDEAAGNESVNLSSWLVSNLTPYGYGYWTLNAAAYGGAYHVDKTIDETGFLTSRGVFEVKGIRPVITIPKNIL